MNYTKEQVEQLLHKLWTNAVGKEGYNKKDWQELEKILNAPSPPLPSTGAGEPGMKWVKAEDRPVVKINAPCVFVIAFGPSMIFPEILYYHEKTANPYKHWFNPITKQWLDDSAVTYWMPLPESPSPHPDHIGEEGEKAHSTEIDKTAWMAHPAWDEISEQLKNEGYTTGSEEEVDKKMEELKRRINALSASKEEAPIREHELKTWPEYYAKVISGEKTFELRKNDRDYKVGDILWLREWQHYGFNEVSPNEIKGDYTGREIKCRIDYILTVKPENAGRFGLDSNYCIMSISAATPPQPQQIEDKDREIERLKENAKEWFEEARKLQAELTALKASPEISKDQIEEDAYNEAKGRWPMDMALASGRRGAFVQGVEWLLQYRQSSPSPDVASKEVSEEEIERIKQNLVTYFNGDHVAAEMAFSICFHKKHIPDVAPQKEGNKK